MVFKPAYNFVPIAAKADGSRVLRVENGATDGAVLGFNLRLIDGRVLAASEVLNRFVQTGSGSEFVIWKRLVEVPPNVKALAAATGTGLFAVTGPSQGAFRAIQPVAGETTVDDGDGVAGDPAVGLADVVPSAGGVLQKYGFDSKGRRSQEEAATTDDLAEGAVNLYYTDARADARIDLQKGQPNGLATLDGGGKLDAGQLPALAITETFVVADEAAMLALTAQQGDVAVRTDNDTTYILTAEPASVLANWQELLTPTAGAVTSFNGRTGAVVPASGDYTFAQIGSKPTTLAGYGITDAVNTSDYTAADVLAKMLTVDGAGSGLDADTVDGFQTSTSAVNSTLAVRTSAGDLDSRTVRTTLANQATISGAIAFRVNNGADPFLRYCSIPSAVRDWLELQDSGWISATLVNSWLNFGGAFADAAYRKIGKRVHLRGLVKDGTTADGTTLFTLPAGYRPGSNLIFPSIHSTAPTTSANQVRVNTTGTVPIYGVTSNVWVSLDGINFLVD